MSREIRPALSPNEWLGVTDPEHDDAEQPLFGHQSGKLSWWVTVKPTRATLELDLRGQNPWELGEEERHLLAALCLYQQPLGFTQEDVALVTRIARECDGPGLDDPTRGDPEDRVFPDGIVMRVKDVRALLSLAARLAALLPPSP